MSCRDGKNHKKQGCFIDRKEEYITYEFGFELGEIR